MLEVPKAVFKIVCFATGFVLLVLNLSLAWESGYEPGQIIVKFTPELGKVDVRCRDGVVSVGIPSLDRRMEKYGVKHIAQIFPHKNSELGHIYQFDFDGGHDAMVVAENFARDDHLLYAVTRQIKRLCDVPNDEFYASGEMWYLNTVCGPQAWDIVHGDSSVIIAIVDTGVDWDHPDLWDNIWVNPGEDLNGDGIIMPSDWNSVDDDGNGYVDDFFGWDFGGAGYPDNDPNEHAPIHGTHCAGIAAAVTDNGLGVAGMSWNCTIMSVKTNRDGQDGIRYGYKGILYAADNGADVISLSWGNTSTSAYECEVIDSAFARGAIIVAAAGNNPGCSPPDTCNIHYPSGNNHVIAVAATDINDKATSWTFYGSWVDVAAPGQGIYNTWYDDSYAMLSGTSMSCPLVAGVAGLLKTIDPEMTSDEFEAKMLHTSDDIYSLNPTYEGFLGGGRVNAYAALLSMTEPCLVLDQQTIIDDAGGNGDGRPDPGETVNWIVTLSNRPTWQVAQNVSVKVSTADETITFLQDSTGFGDIGPGTSADNSTSPFQFTVVSAARDGGAHWVTFYFRVQAGDGAYVITDSMDMMIGRPDVLVVDDDGGDDLEEVYQADLRDIDVVYDTWTVAESGKISAEELLRYYAVIWLTGAEAESTLTVEDQDHLTAFLDAGSSLFLTGQNIGDEVGDGTLFSNYLHVSYVADTVSIFPPIMDGVEGDTLTDGTTLLLLGAEPQNSPSGIQPVGEAIGIYTYRDDPEGQAAATRYESSKGYKVVYFAFGYEGIRGAGEYTSPQVVLEKIMNWFNVETQTGIEQNQGITGEVPGSYALSQNYPNPFNAGTAITYCLPGGAGHHQTTLCIYNILGQEVRTLVNEVQGPGVYRVRWDGRDLSGEDVSAAVYFCRLESADFSRTKKMVLLR